ncbi:MAG: prolipoprotein diacylglyceryl transferase family protein [Bellilinea sp.]
MLPVIQIGPLVLQTPFLILIVGVWLGLTTSERYARHQAYDANHLSDLVLVGLVAGLLGARLSYAALQPAAFSGNLLSILSPTPTMLDPLGGLVVGILAAVIYAQRKQLPLWQTLDALTPGLAVFFIALGVANLASGEAFGATTNLPWGINLWGETRHPAQIYEILGATASAVVVYRLQLAKHWPAGVFFLGWTASTALMRVFLETFRGGSLMWPGGLRPAQIGAWLILAVVLIILGKRWQAVPAPTAPDTATIDPQVGP